MFLLVNVDVAVLPTAADSRLPTDDKITIQQYDDCCPLIACPLPVWFFQHGGGIPGRAITAAPRDAAQVQRRAEGQGGGVQVQAPTREGDHAKGI